MCKLGGRDHNATSYSTETLARFRKTATDARRDHNATSYSTETWAEAIGGAANLGRDHNATSYSTETIDGHRTSALQTNIAEIITLRAIALKRWQ